MIEQETSKFRTPETTARRRPGLAGALALGLTLALASGPAAAEGWSIFKLDRFDDIESCKMKAREVISRYMFDNGGSETGADSWSVYGYDLEPGAQDVVIICPLGPDDKVDALLVVQSESESEDRVQVAEALVRLWEEG
jgi:hypothetical protein